MGVIVENRSDTRNEVTLIHDVSDTVLHEGGVIDVKLYPLGVTFAVEARGLNGSEVYEFIIEEDDDDGFSSPNTVEDARLTAPISDLTRSTAIRLNDAQGQHLNAVGVFNVKRFIRISGTATVSGASGSVIVFAQERVNSSPDVNIT